MNQLLRYSHFFLNASTHKSASTLTSINTLKRSLMGLSILFLAMLGHSSESNKELIEFSSGNQQVHMLELFTSEGCSSCPPADAWLSQFKHSKQLWKNIVPVAFHVDYWDWIGWKDPFASKENTKRQRHYNRIGNVRSVYTPGLMLNGHEFRIRNGIPKQRPNAGILAGTIAADQRSVSLEYTPAFHQQGVSQTSDYVAHVALLGFDIEVDVSRGENKNRHLKHDFVLLDHISLKTTNSSPEKNSETISWAFELDDLQKHSKYAKRFGIATWVSKKDNPSPLQASGTFL